MEKSPKSILSDPKQKIEKRCLSRLSLHKILSKNLELLKEKFCLNEEENKRSLRSMGGRKKKLKGTKNIEKNKTKQNKKSRAAMEWTVEPNDENGEIGSEKILIENDEPTENIIDKSETTEAQTNGKKSTIKNVPKKKKEKAPLKPKRPAVYFSSESEEEDPATVQKAVDSFFITSSGENYQATLAKHAENIGDDDDEYRSKRLYKYQDDELAHIPNEKFNNYNDENRNFRDSGDSRSFGHYQDHRRSFNRNDQNYDRQERRKDFHNDNQYQQNNRFNNSKPDNNGDLHPSWIAKQKQKSLPAFQGKKIQFDADQPTNNFIKPNKQDNQAQDTSDLHPSWAAKLNAKPMISEFVGKKITFDEE